MSDTDHASAHEPIIRIAGLNKWFGALHVLRDIDLTVTRQERIVICGPSGSGKSTLIRCINRLEEHQQGSIVVEGTELTNDLKNIDAIRREVGMVFQQFNLFPSPDGPAELHAGAGLGAEGLQRGSRRGWRWSSWSG